jgi:hypothetical protein
VEVSKVDRAAEGIPERQRRGGTPKRRSSVKSPRSHSSHHDLAPAARGRGFAGLGVSHLPNIASTAIVSGIDPG